MAGEIKRAESPVNDDVTLRDHLEVRLHALSERHDADIRNLREMLKIAGQNIDLRLAELNKLRNEVVEDRDQFVPRSAYEPAHKEIVHQLQSLSDKHIEVTSNVAANVLLIQDMKNSLTWLARVVIGALIAAIVAIMFRLLTGRW